MNKNTARSKAYRAKASDKISARRRDRYASDPEHREAVLAANKAYRAKHKDRLNSLRKIRTYGTDGQNFWDKQFGKCAVCGCGFDDLKSKDVHIDHCHRTGLVRGLLCKSCNIAIGLFKESPEVLKKAAAYLEELEVSK